MTKSKRCLRRRAQTARSLGEESDSSVLPLLMGQVGEARAMIVEQEFEKIINTEMIVKEAISSVEQVLTRF